MSRISDRLPINNRLLDKRVKLTNIQRGYVKKLYKTIKISYAELAKRYGVSKKTIMLIIKPEKKIAIAEKNKVNKVWKKYYNKDKRRIAVKKHKDYKKDLYLKGLLKSS